MVIQMSRAGSWTDVLAGQSLRAHAQQGLHLTYCSGFTLSKFFIIFEQEAPRFPLYWAVQIMESNLQKWKGRGSDVAHGGVVKGEARVDVKGNGENFWDTDQV